MSEPEVVSLFAGIGGFDEGLRQAGLRPGLQVEIDEAARAVLEQRCPGLAHIGDIRKLERLPAKTWAVTAGFPCQDLSQAGRTRGIGGPNSGLVSHVFRLLSVSKRPAWVILENVPFMLGLKRGKAMRHITRALTDLGYRWAYRIVDAAAFGRPQRRRRLILVASQEGDPRSVLLSMDAGERDAASEPEEPRAYGFYWTEGNNGVGWAADAVPPLKGGSGLSIPSAPAVWDRISGMIGTPSIEDSERLMGFRAGWTKSAELLHGGARMRWKLVGNAVSVPLAKWLGQQLLSPKGYDAEGDTRLRAGSSWPHAAWAMEDGKVHTSSVSAFPVRRPTPPIGEFLLHDLTPLSTRASSGFLRRAKASRLRFHPDFLSALEVHIQRIQEDEITGPPRQRFAAG